MVQGAPHRVSSRFVAPTAAWAAREHADRLDAKAAHLPKPPGYRLRLTADLFRGLVDAHDAAAQSAEEALA